MALKITATWSNPVVLRLAKYGAIYELPDLEQVPTGPGVYVFGRTYGETKTPLYIGRARNLRRRIEQQLNSVKLMTRIEDAANGTRFLLYCQPEPRRAVSPQRAVAIIEDGLIAHALSEGHELLQKQGTKRPNHLIHFKGNRTSEQIAPRSVRVRI
jgi:hypothetical protein